MMRAAGDRSDGLRLRGVIVVLWRAGLRISEALALAESDLDRTRGAVLVRRGKGGKRREVGMDRWAWEQLEPWLQVRAGLRVGTLFCILCGPTCGRPCSPAGIRTLVRHAARAAGVRRRFAPHQLRFLISREAAAAAISTAVEALWKPLKTGSRPSRRGRLAVVLQDCPPADRRHRRVRMHRRCQLRRGRRRGDAASVTRPRPHGRSHARHRGIEAASRIASQAPFPVIVLITAGDLPEGVPGVAAEVLAKHHLNHASSGECGQTQAAHPQAEGPRWRLRLRASYINLCSP